VNTTPHFAPAHLQNGTPQPMPSAPQKPPNEHWNLQLQLAQQARETTLGHPHARNHPSVNKSMLAGVTNGVVKEEPSKEEHNRSRVVAPRDSEQGWTAIDFGVQSLKSLSPNLFNYTFLTKLYVNNNRLTVLPSAIGRLRSLVDLDISINEIREIPSEIGMLVGLKQFLAFDNQITDLPVEMGALYQLDILGIEGNPLREDYKSMVMEQGSSELIKYLRENSSRKNSSEVYIACKMLTTDSNRNSHGPTLGANHRRRSARRATHQGAQLEYPCREILHTIVIRLHTICSTCVGAKERPHFGGGARTRSGLLLHTRN
jgi:hypothetical protein